MTRTLRTSALRPLPTDALLGELRAAVAGAHRLDLPALAARPGATVSAGPLFDLLGDDPVVTAADASARVEVLVGALVTRMREARWDAGAAPAAVTSVLAASVPAAEAALRRHALLCHSGPRRTGVGGR